ncbi:ArsR/SmtB family transcription factor [Longispora albida]|uniref:ArsR/SmtB family transcription factor n=1 Tax=Longispora albida TaxID=203523 RepID=UPI00047592FF|nr:metalloregulator ArsR/SmtB family transcription factor [Longispora albida]
MVNRRGLDAAFHALSDPTRRRILAALAGGEHTIAQLAAPLDMSLVAVSKHVTVLEQAGLLARVKAGRSQVCTLTAGPLGEAAAWLDGYREFWAERLGNLARYLEEEDTDEA